MKRLQRYILLVLFMVPLMGAMGQTEVRVKATLDSSRIVIGGQLNLTLEVSQPSGLSVKFPVFKDTIVKSVEVVERGKVDTISRENGRIEMVQKIRITSFDSGLHYIPPIQFEVWSKTAKSIASSNENGLNVVNPFESVDPKKGVFDIKPVIDTPWIVSELYAYIIWALIGLLIIGGLVAFYYYYWRHRNPSIKAIFTKEEPIIPPHVIALRELERIRNEKVWQKNQEKLYYTELTDVLRTYIENRFGILALESTTDELILLMKRAKLVDDKVLRSLNEILEQADLVKFAKYIPRIEENDSNLSRALDFVEITKPVEESIKEAIV